MIKPTDISGEKGHDVTFVCKVDGNPPPSYTWFRNGDFRHVSIHTTKVHFLLEHTYKPI